MFVTGYSAILYIFRLIIVFPSSQRKLPKDVKFLRSNAPEEAHKVSNEIVYNLTNTRQLTVIVRTRQISFPGHIPRLSDGELVKDYAPCISPGVKKKQGRPHRL